MINYMDDFFKRNKQKAFYKCVRDICKKDSSAYSDTEIAINMSSMITHCFIDMDAQGEFVYDALKVKDLILSFSNFVNGTMSTDDFKSFLKKQYGQYMR